MFTYTLNIYLACNRARFTAFNSSKPAQKYDITDVHVHLEATLTCTEFLTPHPASSGQSRHSGVGAWQCYVARLVFVGREIFKLEADHPSLWELVFLNTQLDLTQMFEISILEGFFLFYCYFVLLFQQLQHGSGTRC